MDEISPKVNEIKAIKQMVQSLQNVKEDKFEFKRMTGTSNITYQVDIKGENEELEQQFILRKMSDKGGFIDLEKEGMIFDKMAELGIGPQKIGTGHMKDKQVRLEEFIQGRHPTMEEYLSTAFRRALARKVLHFHRLCFNKLTTVPQLMDLATQNSQLMFKYAQQLEQLGHTTQGLQHQLDQLMSLTQDQQQIAKYLLLKQNTITFCHNDINRLNILCQEHQGQLDLFDLQVIDYEYGEYNFFAFEIANYFNESCFDLTHPTFPFYLYHQEDPLPGISDFSFYYLAYRLMDQHLTKEEYQQSFHDRSFLEEKVKEYLNNNKREEQTFWLEVDELQDMIKVFMVICHFYWTIWSISLTNTHNIHDHSKFNYFQYGCFRYQLYIKAKQQFSYLFENK